MFLIRILLIPFSILYSLIILIRNKLYDCGILRSQKLEIPVISIGNISTGGTGKTPFTIYTANYFLDKGLRVGIVSRGYKRKSSAVTLVSDGNSIDQDIETSGDELILIANNLIQNYKNKFCIAAGKNKVEASKVLIKSCKPDLIILDDAFQSRYIKRNLDIVLVDSKDFVEDKFMNTFTLPSGLLREGLSNLKRADIIVQNNKSFDVLEIRKLKRFGKPIVIMRYKTEYLMDYKNSILENNTKDAILFSGIANHESFISMVKAMNINVSEILRYSDHHNYTSEDIEYLSGKFSEGNIFITTEKDYIKVRQFTNFVEKYPAYFLKIEVNIESNKDILLKHFDLGTE